MQPVAQSRARIDQSENGDARLHQAARDLEATFLAEMLKSAGLGKSGGEFSGGAGEDQFSSLMVRAQAQQIADAGGIGLAETFFHAMKEAENGG
ncbi:MAG: rod-binding protein [Paracoccaceae bacterium]